MKKNFPLTAPGQEPTRVVDAIKHDVRKYLKRERRKTLPEGVDFWDFDCRVGPDQAAAVVRHPEEVIPAIDAAAATDAPAVYVEILAKPGHRTKKAVGPAPVETPFQADPPAE